MLASDSSPPLKLSELLEQATVACHGILLQQLQGGDPLVDAMRSRDQKPGVYWDAKGSIKPIVAKSGKRRRAMAYHRNGKSRSLGLGGDRTSLQEARDAMMEAR